MLIGSHSNVLAVGEISEIFGLSDLSNVCSLCEEHCEFWGKFNKIWIPGKDIFSQLTRFSGKKIITVSKIGNFKEPLKNTDINLKVVRLIRDGRAFLSSILKKYPNQSIDTIVKLWKDTSLEQDNWIANIPEQDRMIMHYENILENTSDKLKQICSFLGIDFEISMIDYWKVKHHVIGVNKGTLSFVKRYFGFNYETSDDDFYKKQNPSDFNDKRWRDQLQPDQLKTFEDIGGELNRKYGYEPDESIIDSTHSQRMNYVQSNYPNISYPNRDISPEKITNAAVVIRSSGERTEALCKKLIAEQVAQKNIFLVKGEKPFSNALERMFQIGIECNLPWTIAVDADLLVSENGISSIIAIAENRHDNFFEINAQMLDKFFGGPKDGGLHLFRTSLLDLAITQIPAEGFSMRPESFVIDRMQSLGYPQIKDDIVLVMHDYEQYYRDIYRKAFFHGKKHIRFFHNSLLPFWERLSKVDPDYRVAIWGFRASQAFDSKINADVSIFGEEVQILLHASGIEEKEDLIPDNYSTSSILNIISKYKPPPEYLKFLDTLTIKKKPATETSVMSLINDHWRYHLRNGLNEVGFLRFIPWLAGKTLAKMGRKIYNWAEYKRT